MTNHHATIRALIRELRKARRRIDMMEEQEAAHLARERRLADDVYYQEQEAKNQQYDHEDAVNDLVRAQQRGDERDIDKATRRLVRGW